MPLLVELPTGREGAGGEGRGNKGGGGGGGGTRGGGGGGSAGLHVAANIHGMPPMECMPLCGSVCDDKKRWRKLCSVMTAATSHDACCGMSSQAFTSLTTQGA